MNRKDPNTYARLEQSLRSQVRAPRLDGRFDAAVWSRIAAEEKKVAAPVKRAAMPKWLLACNVIGVGVTILLIVVYLVQSMNLVQSGASALPSLPSLPTLAMPDTASLLEYASPIITTLALGFGLVFTRFGKRMISALR